MDRTWSKIKYGWRMSYTELMGHEWPDDEGVLRQEQLVAASVFK